jgi:hypothetical protein
MVDAENAEQERKKSVMCFRRKTIIVKIIIFIATVGTIAAAIILLIGFISTQVSEKQDPKNYRDVIVQSKNKVNSGMSCYKLIFVTQCDAKYEYRVNNIRVSEEIFHQFQERQTYSCFLGDINSYCKLK